MTWFLRALLIWSVIAQERLSPAQSDLEPPALLNFSFDPPFVDTSRSNAVVMLRVRAKDELAGLAPQISLSGEILLPRVLVMFRSPSGQQSALASAGTQTSVDVFEIPLRLPKYAEIGLWSLAEIHVVDVARNTVKYQAPQLVRLGFPIEFTNNATLHDTNAPRLLEFSLKPLEDSGTNRAFRARARITDDLAGCNPGKLSFGNEVSFSNVRISISSPAKRQEKRIGLQLSDRVSGNANDGMYETVFSLPELCAAGEWSVDSVLLTDEVGNSQSLSPLDLVRLGGAISILIPPPEDITPPELLELKINTPRISTATDPQTVYFTVRIKDEQSGIFSNDGFPQFASTTITLESSSKKQIANATFSRMSNFSGDTYQMQATLPAHAEGGIWQVRAVLLSDRAGNRRQIEAEQLLARGFQVEIQNDNPPSFKIGQSDSSIILSWSKYPVGFVLETSATMAPAHWRTVNPGVSESTEEMTYAAPAHEANAFFRLRSSH